MSDFYISTTFEVAGHKVLEHKGSVFGIIVRSIGFTKGITGSFRSLRSGEVPQYTAVLEDARRHATDRLVENAKLLGANAVIGMRFDSSEIGTTMSEIVAYGTAVVVD